MEDMPDPYSDHRCDTCGEDLFQLQGDWFCPECDNVDTFVLDDEQRDSFVV